MCDGTCQIDCGYGCVNGTHHVYTGACIKSEVLGDTRYFIGCKHDSQAKKRMRLHCNQAHQEERCLHKCREAECDDLLAPSCESFSHSARKAEKIKASNGNLREENATSLDVREEALYHAVAKADYHEQFEQNVA